ncbi:unnamed protein product [Cylicostephanus goldi]|uniref:Galectin n=1 Tax=Cylicostephanus goldi TaxID=71465 RepID=A0A3P6RD54_CYLGO|nr:unnamed protein product [Cylicostephanus goldi]
MKFANFLAFQIVPGVIPIHEQLHPGCNIDVHGEVVHGHHKDFAVELVSGPHIVLHVNFRFHHTHEVVMNSASHGAWGTEIKHKNPLHHNDQFHLHISVHQSHYEISVNGHHLADYTHRFPMESVQGIGLKGDVKVKKVEFSGFAFRVDWNSHRDYGHSGYSAYGTDNYQPPAVSITRCFSESVRSAAARSALRGKCADEAQMLASVIKILYIYITLSFKESNIIERDFDNFHIET